MGTNRIYATSAYQGPKMNMFEKWIMRRSLNIQRKYDDGPVPADWSDNTMPSRIGSSKGSDLSDNRPMTFNIYRASGGTIVELRKYDTRKDHWDNQLHVIPDEADFTNTLSKIVTLETLRS